MGLLVGADALVIAGASFAAWLGRKLILNSPPYWPEKPLSYPKNALVLATVPITLLAFQFFGLYLPRRDRSLFSETGQIFRACAIALLTVLAALFISDASLFEAAALPAVQPPTIHVFGRAIALDPGRVQIVLLTILLPVAMSLERASFRALLRTLRRRGWNLRHVAVIGVGRVAQITTRTLDRNSWTGIRVSFFISHWSQARRVTCEHRPILGGLDDIERLMAERTPDAVYVALPARHAADLPSVLARLEKFPVDVRIVPDVSPRYVPQSMSVSELDGMPILSYRESPTAGFGGLSKRILDILVGAGAIVVFAPVMLAIAALVRASGPGPIVFKQRRVSLGGQVFDIYKFRTMFHVADEGGAAHGATALRSRDGWTARNDPRVTTIGRWLRRTSLDELPQLFNVLVGDMSLVGPRPERPELIQRFREDWRGYMLRQHVKAGMTGWAQINGHRGDSSLRKRLQYDLFYVKNWSIAFDLKILWLTIFRGFIHKNAH
ncbi:MAG TPA: undecaprenyl-phosphate glucose phosphotransferase [Phycisphaerales bacterium]|nr:undecaprenyl-phosphate glucose phosphotransferase [Phycisphaerales bacterium]